MTGRTTFEFSSAATSATTSQLFYMLLVPLGILWFIYFKLSRRNLYKHAENIPGPPGLPVIGNLFDLMGSSHSKSFFFIIFIHHLITHFTNISCRIQSFNFRLFFHCHWFALLRIDNIAIGIVSWARIRITRLKWMINCHSSKMDQWKSSDRVVSLLGLNRVRNIQNRFKFKTINLSSALDFFTLFFFLFRKHWVNAQIEMKHTDKWKKRTIFIRWNLVLLREWEHGCRHSHTHKNNATRWKLQIYEIRLSRAQKKNWIH